MLYSPTDSTELAEHDGRPCHGTRRAEQCAARRRAPFSAVVPRARRPRRLRSRRRYYFCFNRKCASYAKSIHREKIEGDFEALLKRLQPSDGLLAAARAMFRILWDGRLATAEAQKRSFKAEVTTIEKQVGQLVDRITATADTPSIVMA